MVKHSVSGLMNITYAACGGGEQVKQDELLQEYTSNKESYQTGLELKMHLRKLELEIKANEQEQLRHHEFDLKSLGLCMTGNWRVSTVA